MGEAWEECERVRKWESMETVGQGRMWEDGECGKSGSVKGVARVGEECEEQGE